MTPGSTQEVFATPKYAQMQKFDDNSPLEEKKVTQTEAPKQQTHTSFLEEKVDVIDLLSEFIPELD